MDFRDFEKLVKSHGCYIGEGSKHRRCIYRKHDDQFLLDFAITHAKGSKDFVKPVYVNMFKKITRN